MAKGKMKKAFTILELVVAIALLAMVFSFAGVVFSVSIGSYRTASANAEIMQKLRAITDELNADFKGIRTDAPLLFWFHQDNHPTDPNRYDQIMFFADCDLQSTQLYKGKEPDSKSGDKLVIGNVARIYYGQAQDNDLRDPPELPEEDRLLARRQHILTADPCLAEWPHDNMLDFDYDRNEPYEHDRLSLAQWKTVEGDDYDNVIIGTCFGFRPLVDVRDPNTFHKLMCEGVGSFAIQWAYWDSGDDRFYWFPSDDPDGNPSTPDSHFRSVGNEFGVYFNIPGKIGRRRYWYSIEDVESRSGEDFLPYPQALKFTFTIYDSKGTLKAGRTFTHIVYLGE